MWQELLEQVKQQSVKALARAISLVENEVEGYEDALSSLHFTSSSRIVGVTGPPGAGKSTLVNGLIEEVVSRGHSVAVLCVDPSSPFNLGAVLGDRIRMNEWYTNPKVFIRSLATRGSMGGLHPKIIEITELMRWAGYDYIIVETVGVGQSEIEIAGLADTTLVVLVPEAGDEVQTMKAGLMEIADIFVVNKSDRPDADLFVKNLRSMLAPAFQTHTHEIGIIKTVAAEKKGINELFAALSTGTHGGSWNERRRWLLAEKAYHLIQNHKMKGISKEMIKEKIEQKGPDINLYAFVRQYFGPLQ